MPDTPIEALIHLVQDTALYMRAKRYSPLEVVEELERFCRERLLPIKRREELAGKNPYVLSLVGLTNVGKSTLMEALLEFPVAPRKMGPATAIPVEYIYASDWRLEILSRQFTAREIHFQTPEDMAQELRKRVVDVDKNQAADVAWVTVYGPMHMLKDGLIMADTPGFGAAQTGDDSGFHQERLDSFIAKRVHRVYFCVAAGDTWAVQDTEREFYAKIAHLCGHVIVNKWEGTTTEAEEYVRCYQSVFPTAEFTFVNARRAIQGQRQRCTDTWKASNLARLRQIIHRYSTPSKRRCMGDTELLTAWSDLSRYLEIRYDAPVIPWRRDSVNQFIETCREHPHLKKGSDILANIVRTRRVEL